MARRVLHHRELLRVLAVLHGSGVGGAVLFVFLSYGVEGFPGAATFVPPAVEELFSDAHETAISKFTRFTMEPMTR